MLRLGLGRAFPSFVQHQEDLTYLEAWCVAARRRDADNAEAQVLSTVTLAIHEDGFKDPPRHPNIQTWCRIRIECVLSTPVRTQRFILRSFIIAISGAGKVV